MSFYLFKFITLFGGLALFLFGMDPMGKALERQAGGKLQIIAPTWPSRCCRFPKASWRPTNI